MFFRQFTDFASRAPLLDVRGGGIAQMALIAHAVPFPGAAVDRHRRAGGQLGDDPARRGRIVPQVQVPGLGAHRARHGVRGVMNGRPKYSVRDSARLAAMA